MPGKKGQSLWVPDGPPPVLEAHSRAKHELLERYISEYIQVLAANPNRRELRLSLIDGFAGGGVYQDEETGTIQPGSPIIMLDSTIGAVEILRQRRIAQNIQIPLSTDIDFTFVDSNPSHLQRLQAEISARNYPDWITKNTRFHNGTFSDSTSSLLNHVVNHSKGRKRKPRRALFILDQFGYTQVPFTFIQQLFHKAPQSEVILTFGADWLADFFSEKTSEQYKSNFIELGLKWETVSDLIERRQDPEEFRRCIQQRLILHLHECSGAKYFTPFFIQDPVSNKAYWLIHLSAHPKARDVMLQMHWALSTSFRNYGGPGLDMLGYNPKHDHSRSKQGQLFEYRFDLEAKQRSHDALLDQLPRELKNSDEWMVVSDFYAQIANRVPTTQDQVLEVLQDLISQGEISASRVPGSRLRRGASLKPGDHIQRAKQRVFLFPK